jgi:hypothetical protein
MNLCCPDPGKSCAACCGLYNVPESRRPALRDKLGNRSTLFRTIERSAAAIPAFAEFVRQAEAELPLDGEIHACEFVGFLDPGFRSVGCMLHPAASGNGGIDHRGLCHYGSMACKAFFCPAWSEVPSRYLSILSDFIDDWHLWGLVATDVDYLSALFGLIEATLGRPADLLLQGERFPRDVFKRMLGWKDSWPLKGNSTMRRSRYYLKGSFDRSTDIDENIEILLECLGFTFDVEFSPTRGRDLILKALDDLAMAGRRSTA